MKVSTHRALSVIGGMPGLKLKTQNDGQWWLCIGPKVVVSGQVSCNLWHKSALKLN
jgi:hypothetical protein